MNYISQLQQENAALKRELTGLKEGINSLRTYLHSDKFKCGDKLDSYVNISDVILYLREADARALDAREGRI